MPAYEAGEFEPPAPLAHVVVRGPRGITYPDLGMLLDSGADVSVVPLAAAEAVGAAIQPSGVSVRFYGGPGVAYLQAVLTIELLSYRFSGLFLVSESDYGILGRNILNLLITTLNGPRLHWSAQTH